MGLLQFKGLFLVCFYVDVIFCVYFCIVYCKVIILIWCSFWKGYFVDYRISWYGRLDRIYICYVCFIEYLQESYCVVSLCI